MAGTVQTWDVRGLSANQTYYFAMKTADETPNWSGVSNSPPCTTLTTSELNKPVLTEQDFEYLGAFKLPTSGTDYMEGGIAIHYVGGTLQLVVAKNGNRIYECNFPGWGATQATWPQATLIYDWGLSLYGSPSMLSESMPPSQGPHLAGSDV